ncbi:hypothetical protein DV702_02070 [Sporosarcina sp. PTS2304]|uniref:hypothetical protein n=1 Tax=Sporosarcina sp. PTS2304 TaxID=2283194 RepID=UPI000E0CF537|nr:hypothetical protein [Sporosarcina sp. PTS2304]AXH98604.1 hypothetical protein DV702_02070 [Sporosarcina sp. PTS2304]
MKAIVRILFLLAAVNGGLIYLHYSQFANANDDNEHVKNYRQEIEVINRSDGLYIRHHFYNLSADRYEIIWPKGSIDHGCLTEGSASCSRLNESTIAFDEGERDQQSITYKLPKKEPLTSRKLFKNPFVVLKDAKPLTTVFHMTDEQNIGGMWINGLEQVGTADKERITYRLYRGVGFVNELYWQPEAVPLAYSSNKLTVYGTNIEKKQIEQMKNMLEAVGGKHVSVVLSPRNQPLYAQRFIVEKSNQMNQVLKQVARMSVQSRFTLLADEPSMNSILASLLADEAVGTKAEQSVYKRLKESLSEEQYESFRQKIHSEIGHKLSAEKMDSLLLGITGFESQFFQKTIREQQFSYPFLLLDPRKVLVDSELAPAAKVVVENGKSYYPAEALLTRMGYQLTSNEQSIYIESPKRTYRFSKIQPFYVMNERKFDYKEKPYAYINQTLYFDENWFRRIFLVLIEKTEQSIEIEQIEKLIKEMEKE